jgi:hypothetical protein
MNILNQMRRLAGLPVDYQMEANLAREREATALAEAQELKVLREARDVPGRRSEVSPKNRENMDKRVQEAEKALEYVKKAIGCLERIPSTDFRGEVQHMIKELEAVVNDDESDGVSLTSVVGDIRTEFDGFDAEDKEITSIEAEAVGVMGAHEEEEEINAKLANMNLVLHLQRIGRPRKGYATGWIANLATDEETEVVVQFDYAGGGRGSIDPDSNRFGPDEAAEVDITSVVDKAGNQYNVDDLSVEDAQIDIIQHYAEMASEQEEVKVSTKRPVQEAMFGNGFKSHEDDETKPVNVARGKANKEQVWDAVNPKDDRNESPNQMDNSMSAGTSPQQVAVGDEAPVKVPAKVKSDLKAEIDKIDAAAKKLNVYDKEAKQFYKDLANAFTDLMNHIDGGTVGDIKRAQIYMTSLMSPMMNKIPATVINFLATGGERRSLKDYYTEVKAYPVAGSGPQNTLK